MSTPDLIPSLYRAEYSKMIAVLCRNFGLDQLGLAEDIVADTFLQASEQWPVQGIPEQPAAWLYTVAKNRTLDYLRRQKTRRDKVEPNWKADQGQSQDIAWDASVIQDSQLRMIFAICHPSLPPESQIVLALRILGGFGIEEIAAAFLSNKAAINKRLYRAKSSLREQNIELDLPDEREISQRLESVLTTIYLLFNEGYYSASPNQSLRQDFCLEAMRLAICLTEDARTQMPKVYALLSLMCFHASRFEARKVGEEWVLYWDQDRNLWNRGLIRKGEQYLNLSSTGEKLSKYHLEAAIAYWHTQEEDPEKWENILQLYNYLLQVEYSPVAALNRTYALALANSPKEALTEAKKLALDKLPLYHCLLAELYLMTEAVPLAQEHLKKALLLTASTAEQQLIKKKLQQLV
ncbi:MAG: sigma-70 family RNA polymerase sigma factor [Bacteroidota bacterium]